GKNGVFDFGGKSFGGSGTNNGCGYVIECAGRLTNSGGTIYGNDNLIKSLTLTDDVTFDGNGFVIGVMGGNTTPVNMNGHTLTGALNANFSVIKAAVTGGGLIDITKNCFRMNGGETFDCTVRMSGTGYMEINGTPAVVKDFENLTTGNFYNNDPLVVTRSASGTHAYKSLKLAAGAKIIAPLTVLNSLAYDDAKCNIDASVFAGYGKGTILTLGSAPTLENFEITGLDSDAVLSVDGNSIVFKKEGVVESWADLKEAIEGGATSVTTTGNLTPGDAITVDHDVEIIIDGDIGNGTFNDTGCNVTFIINAKNSNFTASNDFKTFIKASGDNRKFIFMGAGSNGATLGFGVTGGTTLNTHIVFNGGKHAMSYGEAGSGFGATTSTGNNPTLLIMADTTLDFTAKDLCGFNGDMI
ncbi:MAG: hypothetical protein MJ139_06435, partial [Limosilactobacillus sp.]|nr:hypothetical protein [Limosilactobacillus sp.]